MYILLKLHLQKLKKLSLEADSVILDVGFCSKENFQFMSKEQINFITRLPKSHKIFSELAKQAGRMEVSENAIKYGDRVVFNERYPLRSSPGQALDPNFAASGGELNPEEIKSKKVTIYDYETYVHVIPDPSKKAKDTNTILKDSLDDKISKE